jgi:hypothetical protein
VPGAWNNPADGISRLEAENLPVLIASDLTSCTTTHSDNFLSTSRGTNPSTPFFEENDYTIEVGTNPASAFYTSISVHPRKGCCCAHLICCMLIY